MSQNIERSTGPASSRAHRYNLLFFQKNKSSYLQSHPFDNCVSHTFFLPFLSNYLQNGARRTTFTPCRQKVISCCQGENRPSFRPRTASQTFRYGQRKTSIHYNKAQDDTTTGTRLNVQTSNGSAPHLYEQSRIQGNIRPRHPAVGRTRGATRTICIPGGGYPLLYLLSENYSLPPVFHAS